jgi:L-aminopeptidase/D-esterase-like protein
MTGACARGHHNAITDVPGIRVGHARLDEPGALTGTTVVLPGGPGALAAVEVRGGAPGTQQTSALDPRRGPALVHAIVLTGGSAYGLASAAGVRAWLVESGRVPGAPLVPTAAIFDLGRGGHFHATPGPATGRAAAEAAGGSVEHGTLEQGNVGAGTGAVAAGIKGGVGSASTVLPGGAVVGALAVVNAHGSAVDPDTGTVFGSADALDSPGREFPVASPGAAEHAAARRGLEDPEGRSAAQRPMNTVIGVIATDARLAHPQVRLLAEAAQDGLARAVYPAHSLYDGDTVFGLAPWGGGPVAAEADVAAVLAAGVTTFSRAIVRAMLAADPVTTDSGHFTSYRELYPEATSRWSPAGSRPSDVRELLDE